MKRYTEIDGCRLCGGGLSEVISFGEMPLANGYTKTVDEKEDLYPLTLVRCLECGHYQVRETVDPSTLFSHFLYASGDSPTLVAHFANYAEEVASLLGRSGFSVLEIASNDGLLAGILQSKGGAGTVVGVEPAGNLVEMARKSNSAHYIHDFFGAEVGSRVAREFGKFDVVTANNVMAHVADLDGVMKGVTESMTDDGVFIFENAYLLDTVRNHCYDNTYHEHLQYYGIRPLVGFLLKYGLEFFDIRHQPTQSGSFRGFVKRVGCNKWRVRSSVGRFLAREEEEGLYTEARAGAYKDDFHRLYGKLGRMVDRLISDGESLSCYGCSAKFVMLSRTLGLDLGNTRYVVDDAKIKQGLLSPGGKIPIVGKEMFEREPTDACIISAWNLAEPIMESNRHYRGKFILPVPEPRVIERSV
jgi:SAM-dependent methyltransferase